jgi:hypothetical protein
VASINEVFDYFKDLLEGQARARQLFLSQLWSLRGKNANSHVFKILVECPQGVAENNKEAQPGGVGNKNGNL